MPDFVPVITSILDTDAYKLHMQQAVFRQGIDSPASYEFINRNSGDHLGKYCNEIREQINAMSSIALTDEEYTYLKSLPHFKDDYLNYLRAYRFNPSQVDVLELPSKDQTASNDVHGEGTRNLAIRISGMWTDTILWEIPILAIVSEVVQRHRHPLVTPQDAISSLSIKLDRFVAAAQQKDLGDFRVCDFGTRRRFSKDVQEAIVCTLSTDPRFKKHFCGTSNYDLARRLRLKAFGTQAHEWFQAFQQLAPSLRESQSCALEVWLKEYPNALGVALTDCITMDAFLQDFNAHFANSFTGLRHDSGDPIVWGEKAIAHYKSLGIDPRTKLLVFSDGLNLDSAIEIFFKFHHRIPVMFGIGTQLTCSIEKVKPMNIVIKMIRCQHSPVAKVSDAPGKICCDDMEYVAALKKAFQIAF